MRLSSTTRTTETRVIHWRTENKRRSSSSGIKIVKEKRSWYHNRLWERTEKLKVLLILWKA